jgi:Tfp pilus assembly protein PilX
MAVTEEPTMDDERDDGSVLIITLILTIVFASIAMALASYAVAGVRTSKVTTERTAAGAAATAGLYWMIEELTHKHVLPCDGTNPPPPSVPANVAPNAASVTVTCTYLGTHGAHPAIRLSATATTTVGHTASVDAYVQVPNDTYTARVYRWETG